MNRYERDDISSGSNQIEFEWIDIDLGTTDAGEERSEQQEVLEFETDKSVKVSKTSVMREIFSYVIIIAAAVLIYVVISNFVIINANVPTRSMVPTINADDRLLGFRLAYLFAEPERGDVVIFRHQCYADEEPELLVKRIIGMPGDIIEIRDNELYINGILYNEPYLPDVYMEDFGPYNVPDNSYFMMGDNRTISNDARSWTYKDVLQSEIVAKAWLKYYPEVEIIR